MKNVTRDDGVLVCVAGASRFGKTAGVLARVKRQSRLLAWDPRGEYIAGAGCRMVRSIPELAAALKESWDGPGKIAYWGAVEDFPKFAAQAFNWLQLWPPTIVIEEWADVTSSGKGVGAWGELVRKGLYYGAHVYAVTQRPQETDKTTWGNATVKRCYYFDLPLDQRYMSDVMGVSPEEIGALPRHHWIERRVGSKEAYGGVNPPR